MACFNKNQMEDSCSLNEGKLIVSKEHIKRHAPTNETFFKMLQDYRPVVMGVIGTDQRSPGPGDFLKDETASNSNSQTQEYGDTSAITQDVIERYRRRRFAHYDCQSLSACLSYAAKVKESLAQRQNIVTGASAAHDFKTDEKEEIDEICNELVQSCQYFINEVGGEIEKDVSLSRIKCHNDNISCRGIIHKPSLAYGVSILDTNSQNSNWKANLCPCKIQQPKIDFVDLGAKYYRDYFYGKEHQNFLGNDEKLGPLVISVKKEKCNTCVETSYCCFQYRVIIRTTELMTLRGSILEEYVPVSKNSRQISIRNLLEYISPDINMNCLKLANNSKECQQQIMKLDEQAITNKYKVGILYCKKGQSTEEEMYNNEQAGPEFTEFLNIIGKTVRLKGFENYKGGLDTKTDSTGLCSLYTTFENNEIMFHVSTMLPFMTNNKQQILRKRHIGNDIVTIIFQEPGSLPFSPKSIRSQFQHVFIIVRAIHQPYSNSTYYQIAVSRSKDVPVFGPPLPNEYFSKDDTFFNFLITKIINAENAAHKSVKFHTMATRTRQEYLKDLIKNYSTVTALDAHILNRFSIFQQKPKKLSKNTTLNEKTVQTAAYCWDVVLQDQSNGYGSIPVNCILGISMHTLVLIEQTNKQIVFVCPTKIILGWSSSSDFIRIYFHQGECLEISVVYDFDNKDEQAEIMERLKKVTSGCSTIELNLKRDFSGHLGFHVQSDGVVTKVDANGQAWLSGLRPGYRIVEICKIVVATLSYEQLVDLLKTCDHINITVIESTNEKTNTPRLGCFNMNVTPRFKDFDKYDLVMSSSSTYETDLFTQDRPIKCKKASKQMNRKLNFSPPRSSNSSGYGTSSSSRSFGVGVCSSSSVNISKSTTDQDLMLSDDGKYLREERCRPKSIHDPTEICKNPTLYFNEIAEELGPSPSRIMSNLCLDKQNLQPKVNRKKSMNMHTKKHSTFQKDLLNLINPDYEDSKKDCNKPTTDCSSYNSKEEFIFKMNSERARGKSNELSSLPTDPNELDWPSLVNVANKAISDGYLTKDENKTMDQLQAHLSCLETQILKDKQRRKSLEDTVQRLSEENRRLQTESEAAVQQLRTFTEWFFQTIDKKLD